MYAMHDEVEILIVVMDSTAPDDMIQKMLSEFRFTRTVDTTKPLEKVEAKLFPQLQRGRIGFFTRIRLSIAMKKVVHRTIGFIQAVGEETRVIIIAPPYVDREHLGVYLTMMCSRHLTVIGRS